MEVTLGPILAIVVTPPGLLAVAFLPSPLETLPVYLIINIVVLLTMVALLQ